MSTKYIALMCMHRAIFGIDLGHVVVYAGVCICCAQKGCAARFAWSRSYLTLRCQSFAVAPRHIGRTNERGEDEQIKRSILLFPHSSEVLRNPLGLLCADRAALQPACTDANSPKDGLQPSTPLKIIVVSCSNSLSCAACAASRTMSSVMTHGCNPISTAVTSLTADRRGAAEAS